ncbi:hypothetical protein ACOSP7_009927 [Xanthoceras sorbifolium]
MAGSLGLHDTDELLRRQRERTKKAAAKKVATPSLEVEKIKTSLPPPSTGRGKSRVKLPSSGQKRRREDSASEGEQNVSLSFPADASAYSNFGAILPEVEYLIFSEDAAQLKEMGSNNAADWGMSHLF